MLEVQHLSRAYHSAGRTVQAVRDAALIAAPGEFLSVSGHSGSGKSTLLAMIGGILRPDAGAVRINGNDLWALDEAIRCRLRSATLSFVYQFASLIPTLTAEENVLLPTLFGGSGSFADAGRLLELVGLQDKVKRYPSELSGGEQQRIAVARAFINDPLLILADEPTGDLDEASEQAVMHAFEQYVRDRKACLIMVTHDPVLAARASRRFTMTSGSFQEVP